MNAIRFVLCAAFVVSVPFPLAAEEMPELVGAFTVESALTGQVLTLNERKAGFLVQVWPLEGGAHQQLRAIDAGGGRFFLQFGGAGSFLDIDSEGYAVGRAKSGSETQLWQLKRAGSDTFRILSSKSDRALHVREHPESKGAYLSLEAVGEDRAQQWSIHPLVALSGRVKLPTGSTAPSGGISLQLTAFDYGGEAAALTIPEGQSSAAFTVHVPYSKKTVYRLMVLSPGAGYARSVYWTKSGTRPWGSKSTGWEIGSLGHDVSGLDLDLMADRTVQTMEEDERSGDARAQEIVRAIIRPGMTEFEKSLTVYDYIADNMRFFNEADPEGNDLRSVNELWTSYGNIVRSRATCVGYANTVLKLLTLAGVHAERINNWHHSWNLVTINGRSYHLDSVPSANYSEFLRSTDELSGNPRAIQHEIPKNIAVAFAFKETDYPHRQWLSNQKYRRLIGSIDLPAGQVSPPGGVTVTVNNASFHIPPGAKRTFFMLKEKIDDSARKTGLLLRISTSDPRFQDGFYAVRGVTASEAGATRIDPGEADISGITILMGKNAAKRYKIMNPSTAGILCERDGKAVLQPDGACTWLLEPAGSFVRIRRFETGNYLHIQNRTPAVESSPAAPENWWSAQWTISDAGQGSSFFLNHWQAERISIGAGGIVEHPPAGVVTSETSKWRLHEIQDD